MADENDDDSENMNFIPSKNVTFEPKRNLKYPPGNIGNLGNLSRKRILLRENIAS